MSTSVKISRESKRLLDTLQARLVIATGRKYSQQELLDVMVRLSSEKQDELIGIIEDIRLPLPPEAVDRLMEMPVDWGVETEEAEIDAVLYGRKADKPVVTDDP